MQQRQLRVKLHSCNSMYGDWLRFIVLYVKPEEKISGTSLSFFG